MSNKPASVTCDNCRGEGVFADRTQCVRCSGSGLLTEKRILKLRDDYFPRRLNSGRMTAGAFEREIKTLNTLLGMLGTRVEEPRSSANGEAPRPLDTVTCARYGITLDTTVRELKQKFPLIFVEEF